MAVANRKAKSGNSRFTAAERREAARLREVVELERRTLAEKASEARCFLTEDEVNRIGIILEQIEGCGDLLLSHVDLARDNAAMTAVNLSIEKAQQAAEIIRAGYRAAAVQKAPATVAAASEKEVNGHRGRQPQRSGDAP